MAHALPRSNSLDPLPGEAARPSLRLLERPARPSAGLAARGSAAAPGWLDRLRQMTRRSLGG